MGIEQLEHLTLPNIARRTGLPHARLRYVCDEPIVKWDSRVFGLAKSGRGSARKFPVFAGFTLAFVASLLNAGLNRRSVRDILHVFATYARRNAEGRARPGSLFEAMFIHAAARNSRLELGDGQYLRLVIDKPEPGRDGFGWTSLDGGPAPHCNYEPLTLLTVDMDRLRRNIDQR